MYPQTQKKIAEMLKGNVFPGVSYTFIDMDKTETRMVGSAAILPERESLREGMLYDVASLTKVIVTTTLLSRSSVLTSIAGSAASAIAW